MAVARACRGFRVGPRAARSVSAAAAAEPEGSSGPTAVRVVYRGRTLRAAEGERLRTALLLAGESPHNGASAEVNCRGLGTCGTCAVEVSPPHAVLPEQWTAAERLRLNFPPHAPPTNHRLRLACQVRLKGEATVVKHAGFWGSKPERLPDLAPEEAEAARAPLGRLELVLDREAFGRAPGERAER